MCTYASIEYYISALSSFGSTAVGHLLSSIPSFFLSSYICFVVNRVVNDRRRVTTPKEYKYIQNILMHISVRVSIYVAMYNRK